MAQGSDPSPPASLTAIAISEPEAPAIGAWMIGSSTPNKSSSLLSGHMNSYVLSDRKG
jgi:hypothetical protein